MRCTVASRCKGVAAMRAMIVLQLGFATMPPCPSRTCCTEVALTSGMHSGTPSVIRNAELLSTTCRQQQADQLAAFAQPV